MIENKNQWQGENTDAIMLRGEVKDKRSWEKERRKKVRNQQIEEKER